MPIAEVRSKIAEVKPLAQTGQSPFASLSLLQSYFCLLQSLRDGALFALGAQQSLDGVGRALGGLVIVANLHRRLLVHLAGALREEPRAFIASGVLDTEADEVAGAFGPAFTERRRLTQGGWSALLLTPR